MKRTAEIAFLIFVASLATMRPFYNFAGFRVVPSDFVFPLVFIFTGAAIASGRIKLQKDPLYLPVTAYVLALTLAAAFSENAGVSFTKLPGIIYLASISVITISLLYSRDLLYGAARIWIFASTIAETIAAFTAIGFYLIPDNFLIKEFLHHYGSLPPGNYPRVQGTYFYPAMLCNYFTVSIAILFALRAKNKIGNGFFTVSFCLHLVAAVFTLTPGLGGFLLLVAMYAAVELYKLRHFLLSNFAVVSGAVAAFIFLAAATFSIWPIETSPYNFRFYDFRIDPTQRLLVWQQAAETFLRHPVIGRGIGLPVANVLFKSPSGQMQLLTDAHQSWLNIAAQSGLAGLTAFFWLTVSIFNRAVKGSGLADSEAVFRFWLFAGFVTSFIYQGLVGSFEDARHLWLFFGFIAAADLTGDLEENRG